MENPLQRLVGQNLIRISQCGSHTVLEFGEAKVAVFNPVEIFDRCCYAGSTLEALNFEDQERCLLRFSNGREISISLKEEDFTSPEAFSVSFSDGAIVVAP
jgi:hypothetical protein